MSKNGRTESGSGLFLVLVAMVIVAGLITAGSMVVINTRTQADLQLRSHAQAVGVAKAGLVEALSWFRTHPLGQDHPDKLSHPGFKQFFQPILDLEYDPPYNETLDPTIGIVREFEINSMKGLWARYEVRRIGQHKMRDVSLDRCYSDLRDADDSDGDGDTDEAIPDGSAWLITSVGYIFRKLDVETYDPLKFYFRPDHDDPEVSAGPAKPEDQADGSEPEPPYRYRVNQSSIRVSVLLGSDFASKVSSSAVEVLQRAVVATEIRRFQINRPGNAAICAHIGSRVTIGNRGRVLGGSDAGILYPGAFAGKTTGVPSTGAGEVSGTPAKQTVAWEGPPPAPLESYDKDVNGIHDDFEVHMVFPKMTKSDLKAMADIYTADYTSLPYPLPLYSLVYIDGDAVFSPGEYDDGRKKRLDGCGLLFVDGDLTIESSSNSVYRGLIYVTGAYTQQAPSLISGTLISCDTNLATPTAYVTVSGSGDYSEFDYDPSILTLVEEKMSNYRFSRSMYIVETDSEN